MFFAHQDLGGRLQELQKSTRIFRRRSGCVFAAFIHPTDRAHCQDAIRYGESADSFMTFRHVGIQMIYRPSEDSLAQLKPVDYLGQCTLVAKAEGEDEYVGFSGRKVIINV